MIRKSFAFAGNNLDQPACRGRAQTPALDPAERQTAIAEDEKYFDARFLGEVPIKDKRGAIIEKRWFILLGRTMAFPYD
jgi:hypothetical protein